MFVAVPTPFFPLFPFFGGSLEDTVQHLKETNAKDAQTSQAVGLKCYCSFLRAFVVCRLGVKSTPPRLH